MKKIVETKLISGTNKTSVDWSSLDYGYAYVIFAKFNDDSCGAERMIVKIYGDPAPKTVDGNISITPNYTECLSDH